MSEVTIGSLCTGYGGLDLAAQAVFGGELAWWSDVEPGPIAVMEHHHPDSPNIGDVKTVDWSAVQPVTILTAGYPCQPFSNAGKRLGTEDPRHLWPWIAYSIHRLRPRLVVLENVAAHLRRGFDVVLGDLAALGYDTAWSIVRASDVGAPHRRERLYVVAADASREHDDWPRPTGARRWDEPSDSSVRAAALAEGVGRREGRAEHAGFQWRPDVAERGASFDWQEFEPAIRRWEQELGVEAPYLADFGPRGGMKPSAEFAEWMMGVPGRITSVPDLSLNARLKLAGNGVVPQQAEHAIRGLYARLYRRLLAGMI